MNTVIIATNNAHKVQEIQDKLYSLGITDLELKDLSAYPDYQPPEEDGATFAENARIKAVAAAQMSGHIALADDSGLSVQALDGAPGVLSARYAGADHDNAANNARLLMEMLGVPEGRRQASFHCVIAIASPRGQVLMAEGRSDGHILAAPQGESGFGYDPLFYVPELGRSMAELTMAQKNRISHRARALEQALPLLIELIETRD